jgi:hypothetical protein
MPSGVLAIAVATGLGRRRMHATRAEATRTVEIGSRERR